MEDLTNETPTDTQDVPWKTFPYTRSARALYRHLDSSESVPSFNESIWDADAVRSDEYHAENGSISPEISPTTNVPPSAEPSRPFFLRAPQTQDELSELGRHFQRSTSLPEATRVADGFRPTQLEPIIERRSIASLHSSVSRARLGESPVRSVTIVHPERSRPSIHPSQRQDHPSPREDGSPTLTLNPVSAYHHRAFSLDDLDCFNLTSLNCSASRRRSFNASSSEHRKNSSLDEKPSRPAEPRRPSHPPPERSPTPPGIPSFGSPEAIHYFNRPRARSSSWWRAGRSAQPQASVLNASAAARALSANLNPPPSPPVRPLGIRRSLSNLATELLRTPSTQSRRVSLPPGVLRADDGTFVRGRFGGRVSGHGISSRGLEGHPIHRAAIAPRERKGNSHDHGCHVPRQRPSAPTPAQEPITSGALDASNAVGRNASFSSLLTTRCARDNRSTLRRQRPEPEPEPREPRIVDVAASVDDFLGRSRATASLQPHSLNDDGHPRPSTDTHAAPHHPTAPQSSFWHYWRWFCICCCEMSEAELDGRGWYGVDRPWCRGGSRSVRLRDERRRMEEERVREEGTRNASWDSVSEMRRQTGLGLRMRPEMGVGMRYRPGGSQRGSSRGGSRGGSLDANHAG